MCLNFSLITANCAIIPISDRCNTDVNMTYVFSPEKTRVYVSAEHMRVCLGMTRMRNTNALQTVYAIQFLAAQRRIINYLMFIFRCMNSRNLINRV